MEAREEPTEKRTDEVEEREELPDGQAGDEHLPEWQKVFGELKKEADEAYPDGRVRIIVPKRGKRRRVAPAPCDETK